MHYNTPPYLKQFKKEAMIEYFNKQFLREQDNLETCDMDLDADEEGQTQTAEKAEVQQAKVHKNILVQLIPLFLSILFLD